MKLTRQLAKACAYARLKDVRRRRNLIKLLGNANVKPTGWR